MLIRWISTTNGSRTEGRDGTSAGRRRAHDLPRNRLRTENGASAPLTSPDSATLGTDRVGGLVQSSMDEWIVERADAVGYRELAASAGWPRSEAATLLETAGAVTAGLGSSADPVTVAMAWFDTSA